MNSGIHTEVVLSVAYALFLGGAAALLERLARHSHRRAEQYRNSGFTYRQKYDLWECPAGQPLTRSETDYERRVVRYRAPGHVCNSCSLKNNCTDSDDGRVIERPWDSWLQSELRRFHRGISLALLALAILLLVIEGALHRTPAELLLLGSLLFPIMVAGTRILGPFLSDQSKL
jgi:hypothetical protein